MVNPPLEIPAWCCVFRAFKSLVTSCRHGELFPRLFCVGVCRFYMKYTLGKTVCSCFLGGISSPVPAWLRL